MEEKLKLEPDYVLKQVKHKSKGSMAETDIYDIEILNHKLNLLSWKIKFLDDIINGQIVVFEDKRPKREGEVIGQLVEKKYPMLSYSIDGDKSYDYLTSIKIWDLFEKNRDKLKK